MTEDCEQRLKGGLCPTAMPFIVSNQGEQERFEKFRAELTKISLKYGIAIKSIGGVMIGEIADIEYSDDPTSGDLYPEILMWQEDVEDQ